MIKKNVFYGVDDFIKKDLTTDYIIQVEDVCTTDMSNSNQRMVSDNIQDVLQTLEDTIKERCCWDQNEPYRIYACDYEFFDNGDDGVYFYCHFDGDHRNDNYYSLKIYNIINNEKLIDGLKLITEKFEKNSK